MNDQKNIIISGRSFAQVTMSAKTQVQNMIVMKKNILFTCSFGFCRKTAIPTTRAIKKGIK